MLYDREAHKFERLSVFNIIISNYQIDISYYFLKETVLLQRRPSYTEAIIYRQRLSPKNDIDHAYTVTVSLSVWSALCIVYICYTVLNH